MTVFVLGAGATRGASFCGHDGAACLPPVDADFYTQLQRIADPKHQDTVTHVVEDTVGVFGNNFDVTLETVFSTIETSIRMVRTAGAGSYYTLDELQEMRTRLLQAVAAVLEESLTSPGGRGLKTCDHHDWLVAQLRPGDVVLSYNYDCLLDDSLRRHGGGKWNAFYGYGFAQAPDKHILWSPDEPAGPESVRVYKLHGSLHFQVDADSGQRVSLKQRPYTKQHGALKFEIIPPESHKNFDSGVFAPMWANASAAINTADDLVLIGYSFPGTDLHSAALFRASLRPQSLRRLTIVNPDQDARRRTREICERAMLPATRVIEFNYFADFAQTSREMWGD